MRIFGNLCAGLLLFGAFVMFRFVSNSVSRYDYIAAIVFSIPILGVLFALFASLAWIGKLDFLGWPRLLQYGVVAIASLSLTVLIGMSAADHGAGGQEYPWSIRPFCPWAAYMLPFVLACIAVYWLNSERLDWPEVVPRAAFGVVVAVALTSNVLFGVEIRRNLREKAEQQARDDLAIVQQTDAEKEFYRLLMYSSRFVRPNIRQLALQKIVATGPRFNPLMIDCLKQTVFQEGLTYLRDNDPPGDAAPLAESARDAILLSAQRLRDEIGTGRTLDADDVARHVESVLTVADKFSNYGVDFLPAVRDYRAALEAPKSVRPPRSSQKKMDAWLAARAR